MAKLSAKIMAKKLEEYLTIQAEIKELEELCKPLKEILFSEENKPNLPDTFSCNAGDFIKQERNASIQVTQKMIEQADLDIDMILPVASFSMTTCKAIYGVSGEKKLKNSDLYMEELSAASKSVFYKRA